jgi:DDE domain
VVSTIAGKTHWPWQAVKQDDLVPDMLVQGRRDKKAAKRLLSKLLRKQKRAPGVLITEKPKSYAAAKRKIMPGVVHRQHKGLNNGAGNSHRPTRRRERIMRRFKSPRHVQRLLSIHDQITNAFTRRPDHDTATKSGSLVVTPSPPGPRPPARPWLHNHAWQGPSLNPAFLPPSLSAASLTVPSEAMTRADERHGVRKRPYLFARLNQRPLELRERVEM